MLVSQILDKLPASLEWMVLFNLSAMRRLTDENTIKAMYHLPESSDLTRYSHVVLSSKGRFLAGDRDSFLVDAVSGNQLYCQDDKLSLRFSHQIALFNVDEADCLGMGETSPYPPVLLHIKLESGIGKAKAIFNSQPTQEHYELLEAVGVKFLGGESQQDYYLAEFQNHLPTHIHAGILSHFSRTGHCNIFFLQHGHIDNLLETGLLQAAKHRVNWGKNLATKALVDLSEKVCNESYLSMVCLPPPPAKPFPYGNLVPLGFLLKALNEVTETQLQTEMESSRHSLTKLIESECHNNLWGFHRDRLVTATDSALILLGYFNPTSIAALEKFADGKGGYYPQLWSTQQADGKMVIDESCRHWCQVDYATTCMVAGLRQKAGLDTKASIEYLTKNFSCRSGLYFANPYLVDWVLADAISGESEALELKEKLRLEVLASMNSDYTFGMYDRALSTALAILTMSSLGFNTRTMRISQLRLLSLMNESVSIPFYSSLRLDPEIPVSTLLQTMLSYSLSPNAKKQQQQIKKIGDQYHGISLYADTYKMITTALVALALSCQCFPEKLDKEILAKLPQEIHPRYQCRNHCEYIAKFALPYYVVEKS